MIKSGWHLVFGRNQVANYETVRRQHRFDCTLRLFLLFRQRTFFLPPASFLDLLISDLDHDVLLLLLEGQVFLLLDESFGEAGATESVLSNGPDPIVVVYEHAVVGAPVNRLDRSDAIELDQLALARGGTRVSLIDITDVGRRIEV